MGLHPLETGSSGCTSTIRVEVCVGTACHLMGAGDLLATFEDLPEELASRFDLHLVHCFESCGRGPRVKIGEQTYYQMTPQALLAVLREVVQTTD